MSTYRSQVTADIVNAAHDNVNNVLAQLQVRTSVSKSEFKGSFLYIVGISCNVECGIR